MRSVPASKPAVPTYRYPADFPPSFIRFHDRFPWIYEGMVDHARRLKASRRYLNVGVRYLFEHQRYSAEARAAYSDLSFEFALDNNFSPLYGRLIEAQEPDLTGFFRLRRTQDEIAMPDTRQGTLEFD